MKPSVGSKEIVTNARAINKVRNEQMKLLAELATAMDVRDRCRLLGIDENDIESMGFDSTLLDHKVFQEAWRLAELMTTVHGRKALSPKVKTPEWCWVGPWLLSGGKAAWYNRFNLKDGRVIRVWPPVKSHHVYLDEILAADTEEDRDG